MKTEEKKYYEFYNKNSTEFRMHISVYFKL